jgi:hypothetical protein
MKESGSWDVKKMPEKCSISFSAGIETEPIGESKVSVDYQKIKNKNARNRADKFEALRN